MHTIRIDLSIVTASQIAKTGARNAAHFAGIDTNKCEVRCHASGAINSAPPDYSTRIPAEEFVSVFHDQAGEIKVELQDAILQKTEIYMESAQPPGTAEQKEDWLRQLQSSLDAASSLSRVAGWVGLSAEELTSWVDVSYRLNSNPLPSLRTAFAVRSNLVSGIRYDKYSCVVITI